MPNRVFLALCICALPALWAGSASAHGIAYSFQYPLNAWGVDGYEFGEPLWGSLLHLGEDVSAPPLTPVLAPADGRILPWPISGPHTGYGFVVVIEHELPSGERVYSVLGHLSSADLMTSGDVEKGEMVGRIGYDWENGDGGPHLHYGIYHGPYVEGNWVFYGRGVSTGNWYEPSAFIEVHENLCDVYVEQVFDPTPVFGSLIVTDPDGDHFDQHEYYWDGSGLTLLDRGDMGSGFANPVINDEGPKEHKEKWLVGDVDGNGWDDIVLIAHPTSTSVKAHVWLAEGDGRMRTRERWTQFSGQADLYFLGDVDGDGRADLVYATESGSTVCWEYRRSNGSGFIGEQLWVSDFGNDTVADIFLVGDVVGDGKADIIRGYNSAHTNQACPTGGNKLRWRVYANDAGAVEVWNNAWGCADSTYLLGNVNGDAHGRDDLIQVRFDDSTTGRVFVALSNGNNFNNTSGWKNDFGDYNNAYFSFDINRDGLDDLIRYRDDNSDRIYASYSDGSDFRPKVVLVSGVDKEYRGAFRFGNFGEIHLAIGEQTVEDCSNMIQAASMQTPNFLACEGWEYADEGLQMQTCDEEWLPGDAQWFYFWDCGYVGDWFGLSAGSGLTQAQCDAIVEDVRMAVQDEMTHYWQYADGSIVHSLQVMTPATVDGDGNCLFFATP